VGSTSEVNTPRFIDNERFSAQIIQKCVTIGGTPEAPGHRTLTTQINIAGDAYLYDDFAFATRDGLIPEVVHHTDPAEIKARGLNEPFASIRFDFTLNRETADLPEAVVVREHATAA
jgi:catechol 1,2-dioxygenase